MNWFKKLKLQYHLRDCKQNVVKATVLKMGAEGVQNLLKRLEKLTAEEMFTVLHLQRFGVKLTPHITEAFLKSGTNLGNKRLEVQQVIVRRLGLCNLYQMFHGVEGRKAIDRLFDISSQDSRQGTMLYYGEHEEYWNDMPAQVRYDLALYLPYSDLSKKNVRLLECLTDTYGLRLAYDADMRDKNRTWLRTRELLPYVTEKALKNFLEALPPVEVAQVQWLLFWQKRELLPVAVAVSGCCDAKIEGYLIACGALPEEAVKRNFCFPQNFSVLMEKWGAEKMLRLLPDGWKREYTELVEWITMYDQPQNLKFDEDIPYPPKKFLLADDRLCLCYIDAGGKLSSKDIDKMMEFGKYDWVARYFNRS